MLSLLVVTLDNGGDLFEFECFGEFDQGAVCCFDGADGLYVAAEGVGDDDDVAVAQRFELFPAAGFGYAFVFKREAMLVDAEFDGARPQPCAEFAKPYSAQNERQ